MSTKKVTLSLCLRYFESGHTAQASANSVQAKDFKKMLASS